MITRQLSIESIESEGGDMDAQTEGKPPQRTNRIRENPGGETLEETPEPSPDHLTKRPPDKRKKKASVWRDLMNLGIKVAAIAFVFVLVFTFFYGIHRNTDPDMFPRVTDGDLILYYRLDKDYVRSDLLLLDFEGDLQVRRVVAVGGDTVDITADGLVVNGSLQQEPAIYQETARYMNGIRFPVTLEEGQVFVLGDAREDATDSRIYGPVDSKDTLGTVITIIRRRNL